MILKPDSITCENDPVNWTDNNGNLKGFVTGVGLQVEVSGSILGLSGCVGFEQIYSIYRDEVYTYIYMGAGLGCGYDNKALNFFKKNFKRMAFNPKVTLKSFSNLFKFSFSVSIGFFIVRTWGHFSWPDSYLGISHSNTLTISSVKGFYATGGNCKAYGVSYSKPRVFFSISETTVKYYKASSILRNIRNWLISRKKDIMKVVGKYAK